MDPEVDGLLSLLTTELRDRSDERGPQEVALTAPPRAASLILHEATLDAIADRVAQRLLGHITPSGLSAVPGSAESGRNFRMAIYRNPAQDKVQTDDT
jgi:hypothetical protein